MPSLQTEAMRALHGLFNHSVFAIPRRPLKMAWYLYLDESGKFHDKGYICLCGYLGDDLQLEQFNERWIALLRECRIPSFHMAKFPAACRKLGLDETETTKRLEKFVDAIRESRLFGFSVGVDGKYFKKRLTAAGVRDADPALFAVHRILRKLADTCIEPGNQPPHIMLTFDEDEEYSIRCYKLVSRLRRIQPEIREMIMAISFADDKHFSPLQAADLLANLTNEYWCGHLDEDAPTPPLLLKRLLTPIDPDLGVPMCEKPELWKATEIDKNLRALIAAKGMPDKVKLD